MLKKSRLEPVDDYNGARMPRLRDVTSLILAKRHIAAWHLGGMAVECLIKAGVVHGLGITHWKDTLHPKNPQNPKHSLITAVRTLPNVVQSALLADPQFVRDLVLIQKPPSVNYQYPSLRYCASTPSVRDHQQWHDAYKRALRAIHKSFQRHLKGWR